MPPPTSTLEYPAESIGEDCEDCSSTEPTYSPSLKPPVGLVTGALCGVSAAVLYTLANIALRGGVGVDPFLVSAVKAAPTVIFLGPFLIWMSRSGQTITTDRTTIPRFAVASLFGQLFGNVGFQMALGIIGLATSVPICLGVMIIGGAVLGRTILNEPIGIRTAVAMATLILAVIVLSMPNAENGIPATDGAYPIWVGALCAAISGAGYAYFGVEMRQALTGGLSAPATMFTSGVIGTVSLWTITLLRIGVTPLPDISWQHWVTMIAAGLFNFTAFISLSFSLRALPVVAVNLINASQVALAAIAGIILFAEPITGTLMIGVLLTCFGLIILATKKNRP